MCPCFIDCFAPSLPSSSSALCLSLSSFCYFRHMSAIQSNWVRLYIRDDHYPCLPGLSCHCGCEWGTQEGQLAGPQQASQSDNQADRQKNRQTVRIDVIHFYKNSYRAQLCQGTTTIYICVQVQLMWHNLIYGTNFLSDANGRKRP